MTPRRVIVMQELRRSNASGPHDDTPTRAEALADALALEDLDDDEQETDR